MSGSVLATRGPRPSSASPMQVEGAESVPSTNLEDAAHVAGGHARGIAFPTTEADVAALMRRGEPLLAIGAQSSVTGGATPMGEWLVSTARMASVLEVRDGAVRAQAGVTLDALDAALVASGQCYPPVPTWTAATVGGIVSTNAAGPATFKYGVTRDWVLAATIVLPTGDVLELPARGGVRPGRRVPAHRDIRWSDRTRRAGAAHARRSQAIGRLSLRAGHGCPRPLHRRRGHARLRVGGDAAHGAATDQAGAGVGARERRGRGHRVRPRRSATPPTTRGARTTLTGSTSARSSTWTAGRSN